MWDRLLSLLETLGMRRKPCTHPRARIHKWVEDEVCMVEIICPDCGYYDSGHVYGDPKGWLDD